ncbi:unnamed protein product [Rhodiola kirilowii]
MRQGPNESMYDYVEKFNQLERSCCNLRLPEKLLIEYLLDGFKPLDKMLLDASAGGIMSSLPLSGIRELISRVAENARFREETSRQEEFTRTKNVAKAETPVNSMAEEMKQMKEMMMQIIRRQPVVVKPYEYYGATEHKTDECPTLLEEDLAEVNAVDGYQGYNGNRAGPSRPYGQGPSGQNLQNDAPRDSAHQSQQAAPQSNHQFYRPRPSKSLEDMMKELAASNVQMNATIQQNLAETKGAIAEINKQLSQLATIVSELKKESGRLPSQTVQNPRGNVSVVTLKSGKKLVVEPEEPKEEECPMVPEENQNGPEPLGTLEPDPIPVAEDYEPGPVPGTGAENSSISAPLPFPVPARAPKRYVMDKDIWELFSKVEINIPLLEAIKQIPRYAKFPKPFALTGGEVLRLTKS